MDYSSPTRITCVGRTIGKLDVREVAANLSEAQPVTTENGSGINPTESNSDTTAHFMAKEAIT